MEDKLQKKISDIAHNQFQPCDISEVFSLIRPEVYRLRFGAAYQICDDKGKWNMCAGTPGIFYGEYQGEGNLFYGQPADAFVAQDSFFAVAFPKGIKIGYESRKTLREEIMQINKINPHIKVDLDYLKTFFPDSFFDAIRETASISYERTSTSWLLLRKDVIKKDGTIIRLSPRPLELQPGLYLEDLIARDLAREAKK